MRILLCLASAAGGIGTHVADLAASLARAGHEVQVATDPDTRARFDLPGRAPLTARGLGDLARSADVVHAHGFRAGLVAATVVGPTPFVISLHNPVRGSGLSPRRVVGELAARAVMRRADLVTGASRDLVRDARALGARRAELAEVPSPRVPGLLKADRDGWRAAQRDGFLAAQGLEPALAVVLTLARVAPQKGLPDLAGACDSSEGSAQWVLVGPGQDTISSDVPELGVHLAGAARDVSPWLLAADVLLVPSEWEARALVVQEAMAAGVPVVATDVGGLPDLLTDVGVLVRPHPRGTFAHRLAAAVDDLLDAPGRASALAFAARERARGWDGLDQSATRWTLRYSAVQT